MHQGHDTPAANTSEQQSAWDSQLTIPKKWRSAWLTGLLVRHSTFPEHSLRSQAPGRDQVVTWLYQKYPTAHSGAEHQAERYKFCRHDQNRLCYLHTLGNTGLQKWGEPTLRGHVPAEESSRLARPLRPTSAAACCPQDRTCASKNHLHSTSVLSYAQKSYHKAPPAWSHLAKEQHVTAL